jgi:hypothetical protein
MWREIEFCTENTHTADNEKMAVAKRLQQNSCVFAMMTQLGL